MVVMKHELRQVQISVDSGHYAQCFVSAGCHARRQWYNIKDHHMPDANALEC